MSESMSDNISILHATGLWLMSFSVACIFLRTYLYCDVFFIKRHLCFYIERFQHNRINSHDISRVFLLNAEKSAQTLVAGWIRKHVFWGRSNGRNRSSSFFSRHVLRTTQRVCLYWRLLSMKIQPFQALMIAHVVVKVNLKVLLVQRRRECPTSVTRTGYQVYYRYVWATMETGYS